MYMYASCVEIRVSLGSQCWAYEEINSSVEGVYCKLCTYIAS